MGEGEHRAMRLPSQQAQALLDEYPSLAAIVLVAGEDVGQRVRNDEFGAVFLGSSHKLVEESRAPGPTVEGHQRIVAAEPGQPAHRAKISEGALEMSVDRFLPA